MTDDQADELLKNNDWAKWSDARELLMEAAHIGAMNERKTLDAELSRLQEENQRLRLIVPQVLEDLNDKLCEDNERLTAQRDALLAALKELTGHANERFSGGVWDRARAAIKAVEEGK